MDVIRLNKKDHLDQVYQITFLGGQRSDQQGQWTKYYFKVLFQNVEYELEATDALRKKIEAANLLNGDTAEVAIRPHSSKPGFTYWEVKKTGSKPVKKDAPADMPSDPGLPFGNDAPPPPEPDAIPSPDTKTWQDTPPASPPDPPTPAQPNWDAINAAKTKDIKWQGAIKNTIEWYKLIGQKPADMPTFKTAVKIMFDLAMDVPE